MECFGGLAVVAYTNRDRAMLSHRGMEERAEGRGDDEKK